MNNSQSEDLRKLRIIGITYSPAQSGIYAIILQEEDSKRRIPIAIGQTEAQAIQCKLQDIITPRPLTHDLAVNIMRAYGIHIDAIVIRRTAKGIYTADIHLVDNSREITLDARSSDAIALAIRFGAPIYAPEELLSTVSDQPAPDAKQSPKGNPDMTILDGIPTPQLQKMLAQAVEKEQYEMAQRIKNEIDKRNSDSETAVNE